MRISELSERSGVSVASIKYYAREGLLHAGERIGYNQTAYDGEHVARLKLIRALIEAGGLSIGSALDVLRAIDDETMPLDWVFGVAQRGSSRALPTPAFGSGDDGLARIDALIAERGWEVVAENPGRAQAAEVLDGFAAVGRGDLVSLLPAYAEAAELVAGADLDAVAASEGRSRMAETVVVGTVLGDALFAGLRRIAQESGSHRRFPAPPDAVARARGDAGHGAASHGDAGHGDTEVAS